MESLKEIRRDLVINSDENYRRAVQVYFKNGLKLYGVRTPLVRQIAQKYFVRVKVLPRNEIFKICDLMLESGLSEERTIAFDWAYRLRKRYQPKDFKTFERWLINHISDWGGVDDLGTHALGYFIFCHPEFSNKVRAWTKSSKWWMRRASGVALIYGLRRGKFLKEAFKTADILLLDKEDLVQKGYGWMLKVAGDRFQKEVFDYVVKNKEKMPRTALRYAVEKFPSALRQKAMKK